MTPTQLVSRWHHHTMQLQLVAERYFRYPHASGKTVVKKTDIALALRLWLATALTA
jgi:hypothetical protein